MEPEGELVDILEYRKSVDFYSSSYKQSSGRKFESEKLREAIREELHKYSIPALGSNNPARDNAATLGEVFFYYLPEFDSSSLAESRSRPGSSRTLRLTADKATTLAYWYVEAVHNEWDQCKPVEEELIERFLRYLRFKIKQRVYEKAKSDNLQKIPSLDENFEIQKRSYQSLEDLERRRDELEEELDELEAEYEDTQEKRKESEESSILSRLFSPFSQSNLQQKAVKLKKNIHRKRKELKTLKNILNVPKEFPALRKWVRERKGKYEAAKNRDEFERTVEKIQEQREKQQGLTALQPGEFRNMLEGAMEGIAVAAPGGEAEGAEDSGPSRPTFPPYLTLKDTYEQEDIQRIFQAINNDELELGDETARIRSMLLTGDARGAIKDIRSIIKRRHEENE